MKEAGRVAKKQTKRATPAEDPPWKYKKYLRWLPIIAVCAMIAFSDFLIPNSHKLTHTELLQKARAGEVAAVTYSEKNARLQVTLKGDKRPWQVDYPKALGADTFRTLDQLGVPTKPTRDKSLFDAFVTFVVLMFWVLTIRSFMPSLKKWYNKARGKGTVVHGVLPTTRLGDVKGMPEVVGEFDNVVAILKNPERAKKLGARPPAGVVLSGPPGVGKTLLAKGIAGEAGVPFFKVVGSEVRTKWIGDAPKAIKEVFKSARKHPVSVILLDEGDTLAGRRSDRDSGGADEHRATVNELLTQMNRDQPGGHVFVIIVTNHPHLLDPALTRPGRIDMQITVTPPDVKGRVAILEAHITGKKIAPNVNLANLSKETYGFTGADIEALVNNAALQAVKRGGDAIDCTDFDKALVIMRAGPTITSKHVSESDKRTTAFHEAGHALAAAVQERTPNPTGITILTHGQSGGHTLAIPDEANESQYTSRATAFQELVMFMAGLAGEKLALDGDFTNGTSDDRHRATELATKMVCYWGMGTYNADYGRDWKTGPHADLAWEQIENLLDEAEARALTLLLQYKGAFDDLVRQLLDKETLRADDLVNYRPLPESEERFEQLKDEHQELFAGIKRAPNPPATNGYRPVAVH